MNIVRLQKSKLYLFWFLFSSVGLVLILSKIISTTLTFSVGGNINIIPFYLFFLLILSIIFIDISIHFTHIWHEMKQVVFWDKSNNKIICRKKDFETSIGLDSTDLEVVEYKPSKVGFILPGFQYRVLILKEKEQEIILSNILYDKYNFYYKLTKSSNYKTIHKEFNYLRESNIKKHQIR